jgi:protein SCO1/2
LTGTPEQIRDITKKYRVYYSLPESTDQTDYLIDHSMYVYFMGPMGHLKEYFARAVTAKEMKDKITQVMREKVVEE